MQLEPLQGKVDPRRLTVTSQMMSDSDLPASNPLAQAATPRRVLPDGTSGIISRSTAAEGESNCPLWDGHIIDATFPSV